MFTLGNELAQVSVVCTLGACTGGEGGGPMVVVFLCLGVVCALDPDMGLWFF